MPGTWVGLSSGGTAKGTLLEEVADANEDACARVGRGSKSCGGAGSGRDSCGAKGRGIPEEAEGGSEARDALSRKRTEETNIGDDSSGGSGGGSGAQGCDSAMSPKPYLVAGKETTLPASKRRADRSSFLKWKLDSAMAFSTTADVATQGWV